MEGKMEEKFDMKPNNENFEEYGKLCRERTNKSMIKNRQVQVYICHFFSTFDCLQLKCSIFIFYSILSPL